MNNVLNRFRNLRSRLQSIDARLGVQRVQGEQLRSHFVRLQRLGLLLFDPRNRHLSRLVDPHQYQEDQGKA
jgi:hypothetical protein